MTKVELLEKCNELYRLLEDLDTSIDDTRQQIKLIMIKANDLPLNESEIDGDEDKEND